MWNVCGGVAATQRKDLGDDVASFCRGTCMSPSEAIKRAGTQNLFRHGGSHRARELSSYSASPPPNSSFDRLRACTFGNHECTGRLEEVTVAKSCGDLTVRVSGALVSDCIYGVRSYIHAHALVFLFFRRGGCTRASLARNGFATTKRAERSFSSTSRSLKTPATLPLFTLVASSATATAVATTATSTGAGVAVTFPGKIDNSDETRTPRDDVGKVRTDERS